MILASIPSPPQGVWHLGPFPLRAYAFAILTGIVLAWWIMDRRYRAKGGPAEASLDIAFLAVIFGIIGGRLYHVITDNELYFGPGKNPVRALYIWEGGLGIWGAVALGALGAFISCHRLGLRLTPVADALAPALLVAQAIGRIGNYFNQELYGRPTTLPWGLEIDPQHIVGNYPAGTLFHPTFLYEMIWCLIGAGVLLGIEKRFHLVGGQLFAAYIMWYTSGRVWIEMLRIDTANTFFGIRLNVWTSVIVFVGGLIAFILLRKRYRKNPAVNDIWLSDAARERYLKKHPDIAEDKDQATAEDKDQGTAEDRDPDIAEKTDAVTDESAGPEGVAAQAE